MACFSLLWEMLKQISSPQAHYLSAGHVLKCGCVIWRSQGCYDSSFFHNQESIALGLNGTAVQGSAELTCSCSPDDIGEEALCAWIDELVQIKNRTSGVSDGTPRDSNA